MQTSYSSPFLKIAGQIINQSRTFPNAEPSHLILIFVKGKSFLLKISSITDDVFDV